MSQEKYTDLKDFLRKHKTIPENKFTHTSLGQPPDSYPGSYCINDEDLSLFYNLYNKDTFLENKLCHLTEKHKDVSPILIDLDFKHSNTLTKRQYTEDFIIKFLEIYVKEMNKYISVSDERVVAFVLEKNKPNFQGGGKSMFKDGIHIIFPYIITEPKIQYLIRYNTITNPNILELFEKINVTNCAEDIFDIAVIEKNNWQMYGSGKPNHEIYKLSNIYKHNNSYMKQIHNKFTNKEILKLLSIRHIKEAHIINSNMYNVNIEEDYGNIPKQQQLKKQKKIVTKKNKSPINKKHLESDEEIKFVKSIIKILSNNRGNDYNLWIRLGWCLHNIEYNLLESWIEFSKKSDKFVDGECEKEWANMDNSGLGLGTLYLWAKEDNIMKYNELCRKNLRKCMLDSLSLEPNDVARVVYNLYKNEFVCFSSKRNLWYQFINHRWNEIDDAVELKKRLSCEVINEYDLLDRFLSDQIAELTDDDAKDLKRKKKETVGKIIKSLKRTSFKTNVIRECNELFHNPKFEEKLDTNLNLIGFENGIYDLEQEEFRNGLPEDYVSYSTNINYYSHDDDDDDVEQVTQFMSQVLPKKNVREYILTLLGSFIWGRTFNEKFHIWTGCGGNGKSKLIELFENAFGDYCGNMPVTLITGKRASSNACTPELVKNKGKRFITLQEPEENETINVGAMKELTGGDKIQARGLFKDPIEFKPQWTPIMTCNVLPPMSGNDNGVWRRTRVSEFIARFVDPEDLDEDIPYQFPIDYDLSTKLKEWPEAFMSILIREYTKYKVTGLIECDEVKVNTKAYKQDSDVFLQFMNETIEKDVSSQIFVTDGYFLFKEWYKTTGANSNIPQKKEFIKNMNNKYGKHNSKNYWKGVKFVKKENDEEED